jgi:hypothetical protein
LGKGTNPFQFILEPLIKKTKQLLHTIMRLSEIKKHLTSLESVHFLMPNGEKIPPHFHITEVGSIKKDFIDCGGTRRTESVINFQLWEDQDFDHRLTPEKLLGIINLSQDVLRFNDDEVEVEYQQGTIGKFGLTFDGNQFLLTNKKTDCLALDACGIPQEKEKINLNELSNQDSCTPGGGCC